MQTTVAQQPKANRRTPYFNGLTQPEWEIILEFQHQLSFYQGERVSRLAMKLDRITRPVAWKYYPYGDYTIPLPCDVSKGALSLPETDKVIAWAGYIEGDDATPEQMRHTQPWLDEATIAWAETRADQEMDTYMEDWIDDWMANKLKPRNESLHHA